jgi:hypothetical protein
MSDDVGEIGDLERRLLLAEDELRCRTVVLEHQIERLKKQINGKLGKLAGDPHQDVYEFKASKPKRYSNIMFGASTLRQNKSIVSPVGACILLDLLLARPDRDAIAGDLEEYFAADLSKYSARRARLLFWTRTFGAIAIRNPVCRWVLVNGLTRVVGWILRNLG